MSGAIDVACYGELLWDFFEAEVKPEKEPIARTFKRELGGASATEKFLAAAEKAKASIVLDLNARAHLWDDVDELRAACGELAKRATLVKSSERDLGAIAGKRGMTWLEENAKQATWVLTRGENG